MKVNTTKITALRLPISKELAIAQIQRKIDHKKQAALGTVVGKYEFFHKFASPKKIKGAWAKAQKKKTNPKSK